jgi:hypothetical protein
MNGFIKLLTSTLLEVEHRLRIGLFEEPLVGASLTVSRAVEAHLQRYVLSSASQDVCNGLRVPERIHGS